MNLKLKDSDPKLHFKVLPMKDSDPLHEGLGSLVKSFSLEMNSNLSFGDSDPLYCSLFSQMRDSNPSSFLFHFYTEGVESFC